MRDSRCAGYEGTPERWLWCNHSGWVAAGNPDIDGACLGKADSMEAIQCGGLRGFEVSGRPKMQVSL